MAIDACPECGLPLGDISAEELQAHRNDHWQGEIPFPTHNIEAVKRSKALDAEIARRRTGETRSNARRVLEGENS